MFNIFKSREAAEKEYAMQAERANARHQRNQDWKAVEAVRDSELPVDIALIKLVGDICYLGINEANHENLELIEKLLIKRGNEIIANLPASIDQRLTEAADRMGVSK